jgi:hypothetical protein
VPACLSATSTPRRTCTGDGGPRRSDVLERRPFVTAATMGAVSALSRVKRWMCGEPVGGRLAFGAVGAEPVDGQLRVGDLEPGLAGSPFRRARVDRDVEILHPPALPADDVMVIVDA